MICVPSGLSLGTIASSLPPTRSSGRIFFRGLVEKVEAAIAVRAEDHLLAVRRPGPWKVFSFIQSQELRFLQFGSAGIELRGVNVRLPAFLYVGQPFSVGRTAQILDLARTGREPDSATHQLSRLGVDPLRPYVGIVLIGRRFAQHIGEAIASPCQCRSKPCSVFHYFPFIARQSRISI